MTDRYKISDLRDAAATFPVNVETQALVWGSLLALVEAVEAAHHLRSELLEDWESTAALDAALARFSFGEQP